MPIRLPIPIPHSKPASSATRRFALWPITVRLYLCDRFAWRSWFCWHGWETGADGPSRLVYGWTFHVGPLKIYFGDRRYGHG
jgi:hypothetical protein